jgi:MarR family transcriptional regulator, organic hydroperoxide resistance regulator
LLIYPERSRRVRRKVIKLQTRSQRLTKRNRPSRATALDRARATERQRAPSIFKGHAENGRGKSRLDEYIPYLLNFDGGQLSLSFSRVLRAASIRYRMWRVLHTLWHLGPLTLTDVAKLAVFDISTLSRVADDLERRKLIFRVKSPRQRAPRLDLTEAGKALVERFLPAAQQCEDIALRGLSNRDKNTLVILLQRIAVNLRFHDER